MDSTNLAENFSPVAGIVEFIGWHITGLEPKMTGATRGPQVATFRSFRFSINLVRMAQDYYYFIIIMQFLTRHVSVG